MIASSAAASSDRSATELPDTCIVVPCFNEAKRLHPDAFRAYLQASPEVEFLFVDDGSTDATGEVLERLCDELADRCSMLSLQANQGKGEAVRRGLRAAMERERTRYAGYWDADLATPLEEIDLMRSILERRHDIEVVLGVRMSLLGHRFRHGIVRKLLGRLFAAAASLLLGHRFRDTQCGAKLFRATESLRRALGEGFVSRWIFDLELLLRSEAGLPANAPRFARIYEHPLESWSGKSRSKVTPWSYASAAIELPVVVWRYRGAARR